jgi:hypothetical protein
MPCAYLFGDEAGDFKFERTEAASRYFIICTLRTTRCDLGADLHDLRRRMLLRGVNVGPEFHATSNPWPIRREVFNLLSQHEFRVDVTLLEKSKARLVTRPNEATFYQYAWYYHAKFVLPHPSNRGHDLLVTAAALETKSGKAAFKEAFNKVVQQVVPETTWATDFPLSVAEPCLQAADYCAWAIQRKWEAGKLDAYRLIADKVASEFDLWSGGNTHHY